MGKKLPPTDKIVAQLESTPAAGIDDTFRIHVPRASSLSTIFAVSRNVAHLGAGVSPNIADSMLIVNVSHWIASEFVRVAHQCDLKTAQRTVDAIVQREVPLVWSDGSVTRVLRPSLSAAEKVLLVLLHSHPEPLTDVDLHRATEYSTLSGLRAARVLRQLHEAAKIDYRNGSVRLLPLGIQAAAEVSRRR